jgi:carbonic anhydrase/acetyltransferase-like protein (isoleucine patch superfamily)
MTSGSQSDESAAHAGEITIGPEAWIAPNATLTGSVDVGARASIWYGCVVRGDLEPIAIGEATNVQDLSVIHVDRGAPVVVGRRVTIGHRTVVHGCIIDDEAVIGMGAILLSGSRIGAGALVAAGSVVREGFTVPAGTIAAGVPATLRGAVGAELRARFAAGVDSYLRLAADARRGA